MTLRELLQQYCPHIFSKTHAMFIVTFCYCDNSELLNTTIVYFTKHIASSLCIVKVKDVINFIRY